MNRKPGSFRMLLAEYCLGWALSLAGDYWSLSTLRCFGALVDSIKKNDMEAPANE